MTTPPDGTVITPMDLRAHAGEFLDRVRLQHDTFIIERRGTPMAALVPIERLKQMRESAVACSRLMSRLQVEFLEKQVRTLAKNSRPAPPKAGPGDAAPAESE